MPVPGVHDLPRREYPMIKNLTANQIILIAMATVLFLLAAASFFLLQDPYAPLPFAPPSPSSSYTPLPPSSTFTSVPSATSTATRQTSYTPFVPTATKGTEMPVTLAPTSGTGLPTSTTTPQSGTGAFTPTPTRTGTLPSGTGTVTPTTTPTLLAGQYQVTGRVVRNGTPMANVIVDFADDVAPRLDTTDAGGHYWFVTLAPGTNFNLKFVLADNPQLAPITEITSLAWIEGSLPTGLDPIQLPDLELSLNLNGMIFALQGPAQGASYSASAINTANKLQFVWSVYNQGESYFVELGQNNNDVPIWTSGETTSTNTMWDGILDNGLHITQGNYWWRVSAVKTIGDYFQIVYTQEWTISFTP
jgi:hypothetical protein